MYYGSRTVHQSASGQLAHVDVGLYAPGGRYMCNAN